MPFTGNLQGLDDAQVSDIYQTIKEYCCLTDREIKQHYDRWRIHNRGTGHKNGYCEEAFISINKIHPQLTSNNEINIPTDANCYGIDFPYWFNWKNPKKKKILFVGINPNRELKDWRDFNFEKDRSKKLLINSGWGAHNEFNFDIQYQNFFLALSKQFSFYFTDLQKLFFWWDSKRNSYKHKSFASNKIHKQIFDKELSIVKPDIIIAFGNDVPKALALSRNVRVTQIPLLKQHYNNIPFYHFPHLSKSVRENLIKDFYNANNVPQANRNNGRGSIYAEIFITTLLNNTI